MRREKCPVRAFNGIAAPTNGFSRATCLASEFPDEHVRDLQPAMFVLKANRAARGQAGNACVADHFLAVEDDSHAVAAHGHLDVIPLAERAVGTQPWSEGAFRFVRCRFAQFPKFTAADWITEEISL